MAKDALADGVLFSAVSLHAFLVELGADPFAFTSIAGLMIVFALSFGLLAYLYKQTFYRTTQRHAFTLTEVNPNGARPNWFFSLRMNGFSLSQVNLRF